MFNVPQPAQAFKSKVPGDPDSAIVRRCRGRAGAYADSPRAPPVCRKRCDKCTKTHIHSCFYPVLDEQVHDRKKHCDVVGCYTHASFACGREWSDV